MEAPIPPDPDNLQPNPNVPKQPTQQVQPPQQPQQQPQQQKPQDPNAQLKTGDQNDRIGYVNVDQAAALIRGTKGKIFTCIFQKKDGSMRTMNARLGVKAYLHGGVLPYNPNEKRLIPVFDIQKREYRMINIDGIKEVRINNFIFKVQ